MFFFSRGLLITLLQIGGTGCHPQQRPWFVTKQLLAIEPWVPNSITGTNMVWKMVVWLRSLRLLIKFWNTAMILGIAEEARKPIAMDNFMDQLQKLGYARIQVEIDDIKPLKPRVLVREKDRFFFFGMVSRTGWFGLNHTRSASV